MRSRTWIVAVAVAGLLAAGASAPAYAEGASSAPRSTPSAEQHGMNVQDKMSGMSRMHEQMMKGMPNMASMNQEMMQTVPGMAKMCEQMMTDHPSVGMPPTHAHGNQGE